jgi:aconitase A
VPPATGIVHQVNLEYLARVVFTTEELSELGAWRPLTYPDTVVGTDSHTPMIKPPPFLEDMAPEPPGEIADIRGVRVLALLDDSVTTDHISPAGSSNADSPAGRYLIGHGVGPADFNSYGARRGNHEVMVRGTFASVRVRNRLAPGTEGGVTAHVPSGEVGTIFDVAERYQRDGTPLLVLAGKEYRPGSSRDGPPRVPRSSACERSSPRVSSASTARTWSGWASFRSSSCPARAFAPAPASPLAQRDALVDEGSAESFPASDPPAY